MKDNSKRLNVPLETSVKHKTNFIKTAVCELRFPTLLELEDNPPIKFQTALRKLYPFYSEGQGVSINPGGTSPLGKRYLFESRKRDWTIALRSNSISLETNKYTHFKDFLSRFDSMIDTVGGLLDTDFFTRVGLRYINSVPLPGNNMNRTDIQKWINPVLVAPLIDGELGTLKAFRCEVSGFIDNGSYTFRYGFSPQDMADRETLSYLLDYDYSTDGVEYSDVQDIIKQFNTQNYNLFKWSLSEKSIEALDKGANKK